MGFAFFLEPSQKHLISVPLNLSQMKNLYDKATGLLLERGWLKENPASFNKGELEVFFDTSSYVQVFNRESKQCIYDSHLLSADDYERFLDGLRNEFAAS